MIYLLNRIDTDDPTGDLNKLSGNQLQDRAEVLNTKIKVSLGLKRKNKFWQKRVKIPIFL